jgi:hypothetical protein
MNNMTIAQALRHAKKLKGRIDEARTRATGCVSFYADAAVAFDFAEQLKRADDASAELAELQGRLAVANARETLTHDGATVTVAHAVRVLQELRGRIAWLRALAVKQTERGNEMVAVYIPAQGHMQTPREVVCRLPEATKAARVDELQEKFDTLNAAVEALNHTARI